jgi:hypothetical protein
VARWRRPGADEILLIYLLLATIGFIGNWLSRSAGSQHPLLSFLITAFLTWRVSRGGWFARRILIVASFASAAVAAVDVARLGAAGAQAAGVATAMGAARGSASDARVPGEH